MSLRRAVPTSRHLPAATWAVIAMLALVACSPFASAPSPSEAGALFGDTTVIISGRSFSDDITIGAGSSVTFLNDDELGHTVTNGVDGVAAADALFDFSLPAGATSDPIVFDTPGAYDVTCKVHPTMHMIITVE
jgi:plastocyanin